MGKLTRVLQRLFASTSGSTQIGVFGSLAAGSPQYAGSDAAAVQALPNFLAGWPGAVIGGNSPAIEDLNALCYLYGYQLAYMFQEGVPEYQGSTTYFLNSIVKGSDGALYQATYGSASGFSGIVPPNGSYWIVIASQTVVEDSSSGTLNTTGSTITGLSVSMATNGRPVVVSVGHKAGNGVTYAGLFFYGSGSIATISGDLLLDVIRDGSVTVYRTAIDVGSYDVTLNTGSNVLMNYPLSIYCEDTPPAGSHTYILSLSATFPLGSGIASVNEAKLTVRQL